MSDAARTLHALIQRLRRRCGTPCPDDDCRNCPADGDRLIWRLVHAFLTWEASTRQADQAMGRLMSACVDFNDVRVLLPDELVAIVGPRYPQALERCLRLRATLHDIFRRQHALSLAHLASLQRCQAHEYLLSLEGMLPFAAARLMLLTFKARVFPLDQRLHQALLRSRAVPRHLNSDQAAAWLEHQFRGGDVQEAYLLVESWFNGQATPATQVRSKAARPPRTPGGTRSRTGRQSPSRPARRKDSR